MKWLCLILCPFLNLKRKKPDAPRRFSKNKSITVTFRLECLLMGFWHNECFTEISNHTPLINSPFLEPPSVSHNCQPFERASIISYTFISHLLTAAERASRNMDKVAANGLITIKLFSVVFMGALTGHGIAVASTPKCTLTINWVTRFNYTRRKRDVLRYKLILSYSGVIK